MATAAVAAPRPVVVQIEAVSEDRLDSSTGIGILLAQSLGGEEEKRVEVAIPGSYTVQLESDQEWLLKLGSESFWAAPVRLGIAETESIRDEVLLKAFPAGLLVGGLVAPAGIQLPESLHARFEFGGASHAEGDVACPINAAAFRCVAPAGRLDLRLAAGPLVPHYLWGVELSPGAEKDLGRLRLEAGASVAGWIEVTDSGQETEAILARASATLRPELGGILETAPESERSRLTFRQVSAKPAPNGFFQIFGISPGAHHLEIKAPGHAAAVLTELDITADTETFLSEPLLLHPPLAVELVLDPPFAPWGEPWTVVLLERRGRGAKEIVAEPVDLAGAWRHGGLDPGSYLLFVKTPASDGRGTSTWAVVEVTLDQESEFLPLSLDVIELEGEVSDSEGPVEARLWFGGRTGRESIQILSDAKGHFSGFLPREGVWELDVERVGQGEQIQRAEPVDVDAAEQSRKARLRIELSLISLSGEVVDAEGTPVPGAGVLLVNPEKRSVEANALTDEAGLFEFTGLRGGDVQLSAEAPEGSSEWLDLELRSDGDMEPVRLVLRRRATLVGTVRGPWGPVAGAAVYAYAPRDVVESTLSGSDGRFEIRVPSSEDARLVVVAPGLSSWWRAVAAHAGEPTSIEAALAAGGGRLKIDMGDAGDASLIGGDSAVSVGVLVGGPAMGEVLTPLLEAGSYVICPHLPSGDMGLDCESVTVLPDAEVEVHLQRTEKEDAES